MRINGQPTAERPPTLRFLECVDGTRRMFALAAPLLAVLENGYIVLVDELGIHLHPELVQALIRLFNHPLHNPKHVQLIFTTHETALLDQALLRRDQSNLVLRKKAGSGNPALSTD